MFFNLVKRTSLLVPALVLLTGLLGTAMISVIVWKVVETKDRARFGHSVDSAHDAIRNRLDAYITLLQSGAALFAASEHVSYDEFAAFVDRQRMTQRFPGIQGIGFSLKLDPARQEAVARELEGQGIGNFRTWPASPEDETHSIVYIQPVNDQNLKALGFNMFSEPTRREAMVRAYMTGEPAASGKVKLVQDNEKDQHAGFLIYVPIYANGASRPLPGGQREDLLGYIYAPFRIDDLLNGIFSKGITPDLGFRVYDGSPQPENLLHDSVRDDAVTSRNADFFTSHTLDVAGWPWTIHYTSLPVFELSSGRLLAPLILVMGILTTLIMTAFSLAQVMARRFAEQTDQAAQRYARELETLNKAGAQLAAQLDPDHLLLSITQAGQDLSHAEYATFLPFAADLKGVEQARPDWLPDEVTSPAWPRYHELMPAYEGRHNIRIDDVGKWLEGVVPVPVICSLMLVPVVSRSAEVLGVLVFAHGKANAFTERTEQIVAGVASQAAIALDNARLYRSAQIEIAERARGQSHSKLLLDELNHRVKNTLATVQSIALMTIKNSETFETFREAFDARLMSLSHTHNLLTHSKWEGASLQAIIARELEAYKDLEGRRFTLEGEDIRLPPSMVVSFGMVIHELATNAAKYGALSVPNGHVNVTWVMQEKEWMRSVHLVWQESGGPLVEKPRRRGFGTKLIERGLNQDLGGGVRFEFAPTGARCSLEIPLMVCAEAV